jgi:hypothetical protein
MRADGWIKKVVAQVGSQPVCGAGRLRLARTGNDNARALEKPLEGEGYPLEQALARLLVGVVRVQHRRCSVPGWC